MWPLLLVGLLLLLLQLLCPGASMLVSILPFSSICSVGMAGLVNEIAVESVTCFVNQARTDKGSSGRWANRVQSHVASSAMDILLSSLLILTHNPAMCALPSLHLVAVSENSGAIPSACMLKICGV